MSMPIFAIVTSVLISVLISIIAVPAAIRLGKKYNLLDRPGKHKRHKNPVPFTGGSALFVVMWGTVLILLGLSPSIIKEFGNLLWYIFLGSSVIYGVGLWDDIKPLPAWVKLFGQTIAGVVLFVGGLRTDPISIPFLGQFHVGSLSLLISVLWVVGLTNSVNLIDGLDGLAAGVCLIGAGTLVAVAFLLNVGTALMFSYILIGFLIVFLIYNRYPARIFLGDSGSLQIGYYFAVLSLMVPLKSYTAAALYLPLLALGVPIMEAVISTVRRVWSKRSIVQADRRHLFHYLAMAGLNPHQIVIVFYLLSFVFGLFSLAMFFWDRILVFTILILFMVVIFGAFFIFIATQSRQRKRTDQDDRSNSVNRKGK
jgi:UDP-GlcNAc:undecaprenyl-phosphate/decaprenyl-phosphate GlcNAc-1-phosphate transferase